MSLTRNILTTLSARVFVMGLGLVSSLTLARALGPEGRGLLALVLLLPELARNFAMLGFDQANAVYAGLEPNGRRVLAWQSFGLALIVGMISALACVVYIYLGAPGFTAILEAPPLLIFIPIALIPLRLLFELWCSLLRGMNFIVPLNLIEVGQRLLALILVLIAVVGLGFGVAGAVVTDTLTWILVVAVVGGLLALTGNLGMPTFDAALARRTIGYAMPAYCACTMTYLNYRIDQFLVAALLTTPELAFYGLAVEIVERLWIIPGAVGTALLPHITTSPKRDPELTATIARHALAWVAAAAVILALLCGILIQILYGTDFVASAAPLRWLLPGILTMTVSKVLIAELAARERIGFTVWLMFLAAVCNVLLNLILIPLWGISGAAMASSLSYTLVAAIITYYFLRETGLSPSVLLPRRSDIDLYRKLWQRWKSRGQVASASPS